MTRCIGLFSMIPDERLRHKDIVTDVGQVQRAFEHQYPHWKYEAYDMGQGHFPDSWDRFDGVVFSGSPASVNDDAPWVKNILKVIVQLHQRQCPMVGICFGHQAIAKALGGEVKKNPSGWSLGIIPVNWKKGDEDFKSLDLCSIHEEQVTKLPKGGRIIFSSQSCPIGGFALDDHILTIQFHPEMTREYALAVVNRLSEKKLYGPSKKIIDRANVDFHCLDQNLEVMEYFGHFFNK